MSEKYQTLDVSGNPAMRDLVDEVVRTRRPKVLRNDKTGAEVEVRPLSGTSRRPRVRRTSADDPYWRIVGIGASEQATDVAENHDRYLADAYSDVHPE